MMVATQERSREFSRASLMSTVIGMASSMPQGPQTHPQNNTEKSTTDVAIPNCLPRKMGSMPLPMAKLMAT